MLLKSWKITIWFKELKCIFYIVFSFSHVKNYEHIILPVNDNIYNLYQKYFKNYHYKNITRININYARTKYQIIMASRVIDKFSLQGLTPLLCTIVVFCFVLNVKVIFISYQLHHLWVIEQNVFVDYW